MGVFLGVLLCDHQSMTSIDAASKLSPRARAGPGVL